MRHDKFYKTVFLFLWMTEKNFLSRFSCVHHSVSYCWWPFNFAFLRLKQSHILTYGYWQHQTVYFHVLAWLNFLQVKKVYFFSGSKRWILHLYIISCSILLFRQNFEHILTPAKKFHNIQKWRRFMRVETLYDVSGFGGKRIQMIFLYLFIFWLPWDICF